MSSQIQTCCQLASTLVFSNNYLCISWLQVRVRHSFETAVPAVSKVMLLQILCPSICLHLAMESLVQRCRGSGLSSLHDNHSLGYPSKYSDIHNVGIQLLTHMHTIIQHNVYPAWYIDSSVHACVCIYNYNYEHKCMHSYIRHYDLLVHQ